MRLYALAWTINDPVEMLTAIGQLEKTGIDYTLLTPETIGIRPKDLFRTMKVAGLQSSDIDRFLYQENGKPHPEISMKSLDVQGDIYRVVYHVLSVGNITAATDDPEVHDPELLMLPYSGLYDPPKEEILHEYASYLGFKEIP